MKKTTNNKVKPTYVVDITKCNDLYDTAFAFAIAKQKAGQPLSDENIDIICAAAVDAFGDFLNDLGYIDKKNHFIAPAANITCICNHEEKLPKKENIFKRFWNWLKHPFA